MIVAQPMDSIVKPRLVLISFTEMSRDVRILRHLEALKKSFHTTTISYGPQPFNSQLHYEIPEKCGYLPLNPIGLSALVLKRYQSAISNTAGLNYVKSLLPSIKYDVLFLNDVQSIPLSSLAPSPTKLIIDMHEFAPREMEDDWRFRFLLQGYYTWLCKKYLPKADLLITVSEGLKNGYDELCGTSAHVIRNICKSEELAPSPTSLPTRLVHSGLAVRGRKLEAMIYAIGGLENIELDFYLVEAPRQKRYLKFLKQLASKYENVRILDPVQPKDIARNLNSYDVGLIVIAASNFSLKHGLPNKLFDYVQARIMTICGPSPDMAEVVKQNRLGHVLGTYEPEELREYVKNLTRAVIVEFKANSDEAAKVLNQEYESKKLSTLIAELVSNN